MSYNAKPARDPFAFSLRGAAAINMYTVAPVVADDRVNKTWDERLERKVEDQPDTIREFENFLARYFAGGLLRAA